MRSARRPFVTLEATSAWRRRPPDAARPARREEDALLLLEQVALDHGIAGQLAHGGRHGGVGRRLGRLGRVVVQVVVQEMQRGLGSRDTKGDGCRKETLVSCCQTDLARAGRSVSRARPAPDDFRPAKSSRRPGAFIDVDANLSTKWTPRNEAKKDRKPHAA